SVHRVIDAPAGLAAYRFRSREEPAARLFRAAGRTALSRRRSRHPARLAGRGTGPPTAGKTANFCDLQRLSGIPDVAIRGGRAAGSEAAWKPFRDPLAQAQKTC